MGKEMVEKLLKEELGLKDDIMVGSWCPNCHVMILDPVNHIGTQHCRHCKEGEALVRVYAHVDEEGDVIFRREK